MLAIRCLGLVAILGTGLYSQVRSASVVRPGSFEAGIFGGQSFSRDQHFMIGGNVTYAATRVILPYVEYTYFPSVSGEFTIQGSSISAHARLPPTRVIDFHGGVHIRVPLKESRIVPYGVVGAGVLSNPAKLLSVNIEGISIDVPVPAAHTPAVNVGAGIRYYFNSRLGIRTEMKYYRGLRSVGTGNGSLSQNFGKYEFGVFYQFR